jgi:hypothetical protein
MIMIGIKLNTVLDQCSEKINIGYYMFSTVRDSVITELFLNNKI